MRKLILHNLIEKEGDLYSAICLELNVASQGKTIKKGSHLQFVGNIKGIKKE